MIYNNTKKFTLLSFLFALFTLVSCIDDDLLPCVDNKNGEVEGYTDGYAINLTVTLDKMGGRRAQTVGQLEDIESYIDPEKFRILFFDHNDKFLFESKSRWVKQLSPSGNGAEWLVSVPMYTIGNDETYNWEWDSIRTALTSNKFKIAILANRPTTEWCPQMKDTNIPATWFDNTGPHWGREQTSWFAREYNKGKSGDDQIKPKDVFDIHHSQYDPIYTGKSWSATNIRNDGKKGFYEFIMEKGNRAEKDNKIVYDSLYMSSTSSWVEWGNNDKGNRDKLGWDSLRHFIQPTQSHPIPMYGIQEFDAIKNWIKGTPFNLSKLIKNQDSSGSTQQDPYDFKNISLLRSVVRLELLIPKSDDYDIDYVIMFYPNIYARCEPMDVWTPTDSIWDEDHADCKDWKNLKEYGPVARLYDSKYPDDDNNNKNEYTDLSAYQQRMSWFYGAWQEKGWNFRDHGFEGTLIGGDAPALNDSDHYPRIMNSCVQRHSMVECGDEVKVEDPYYHHYVVYTGERNINDPSYLNQLGRHTSGAPTICYWAFRITTKAGKSTYYAVPLTSYEGVTNDTSGPAFTVDKTGETAIPSNGWVNMNNYEKEVMKIGSAKPKPWPLIRNHVYRITVTGTDLKELTTTYSWDFAKALNTTTVYNLNADPDWTNPGNGRTVHLSWYAEEETKKTGPTLTSDGTSNYKNKATWTIDGKNYSITKASTTSGIENYGNTITIDGKPYTPIKTSKNIKNILKLPDNIKAKKITLYSFINKDAPAAQTSTIFSANATTKEQSVGTGETKITSGATITNGEMYAINRQGSDKKLINDTKFCFPNSDTYFKIKLNSPLAVGDVISATTKDDYKVYITKNDHSKTQNVPNSTPTFSNSNKYTIKAGDELVGTDVIYLYRVDGTTYFNDFKITRTTTPTSTPTYWSEINGNEDVEYEVNVYRTQGGYVKHEFECDDDLNEFTFTNAGEQLCYVVFVDVEDANNTTNYWSTSNINGDMKANGSYITELRGLKFKATNQADKGQFRIYKTDPKILLTKGATITFPKVKAGSKITIVGDTPKSDGKNYYIKATNLSGTNECKFKTNEKTEFTWEVDKDTTPEFELVNDGGVYFYEFRVDVPDSSNAPRRASKAGELGITIKSEDLHSKSIRF